MDSILSSFDVLACFLQQQEDVTFLTWFEQITINLSENLSVIACPPLFKEIMNNTMTRPSPNWKPVFSPQVTIQHPLQYTIPLFFGMFGFESPLMPTFCAALPFRDLFEQAQQKGNSQLFNMTIDSYRKPVSGIAFLHALTLIQMAPREDAPDGQFLRETFESLEKYHQVDPKMKLTLMSRRPFSEMLKSTHINKTYAEFFNEAMSRNVGFRAFDVCKLFSKANYAEQFYDQKSGQVVSLENFLLLFRPEFVQENEAALRELLRNGVVSTAMLRNTKQKITTDDGQPIADLHMKHFAASVSTIESPADRYIIHLDPPGVQRFPYKYDALSPPWFLDASNSMGAYKQEMTPEEAMYGEAIVEVRGIKWVGAWFFRRAKLDEERAYKLLSAPDRQLKHEALALFGFLSGFGTFEDLNDITLGMSYAILKH